MNVQVTYSMVTTERQWGLRLEWYGWRHFFSMGLSTNILAPAVAIAACGCHLWFGRILKKVVEPTWEIVVDEPDKAEDE